MASIIRQHYTRNTLQKLGDISKYQAREITRNLVPAYRNSLGYHYCIRDIYNSILIRLSNTKIQKKSRQSLSNLLSIIGGFIEILDDDSQSVYSWIDKQKLNTNEEMKSVQEEFMYLNELHGIHRQTSEIEWKRLRLQSQQSVEDRVNALILEEMNINHEV